MRTTDQLTVDDVETAYPGTDPTTTAAEAFNKTLDSWGELHVTVEGHGTYHVHKHDTVAVGDSVYIHSKDGDWDFPLEHLEIGYPHSHKEE